LKSNLALVKAYSVLPKQWFLKFSKTTGCILERSRAPANLEMIVTYQVVMRVGPYGAYVQLGEASKKQNPRRTTVPKACTEPAKAIQT
jgi:hypothetical protein